MTDKKKIIIGSRGSKLSLAYANYAKKLLIRSNSQFGDNSIDIKIIKTSGDIFQNKRIADTQYLLIIILFVLLVLLGIFMSFNLANCEGDCL